MQRVYLFIFFLISFISCDFNKPNWTVSKDFDPKDENAVVIIDNQTCKIPSTTDLLMDSLLIGTWKDSATWLHDNDCIYSVNYYNKSTSLDLRESKRCILKTKTPKSEKFGDGAYWTKTINDSNFLFIAFNDKNDTIFEHGDTMYMQKYYVNYFDSVNLYLTAFEVTNKKYDKKTAQLKRTK
ncbi:hypothetical protein [Acidiluteibacter ferrifornacis]|uniref:Uncharacterized protein n=1 Tax=Acidiluteibacter ferrifornacis TaxID=2692424 RepID=A0A6N9NI00_9FLAO|nr:hypothetical protein [Acidiluteibacter ferrifornacis]NBG65459.1 hypothetical protein [Acidiluteibacter ferrifornacis]